MLFQARGKLVEQLLQRLHLEIPRLHTPDAPHHGPSPAEGGDYRDLVPDGALADGVFVFPGPGAQGRIDDQLHLPIADGITHIGSTHPYFVNLLGGDSALPQGPAGLGTGIVKFAGLTDDNGAGAQNQNGTQFLILRYKSSSLPGKIEQVIVRGSRTIGSGALLHPAER